MRSRRSSNPEFGAWLRKRRGSWSQRDFALKAGLSAPYLSDMEHGLVPTREFLEDLAKNLGDDPLQWLRAAGIEKTAEVPPEAQNIEGTSGAYVPTPSTHVLPVRGPLKADTIVDPDDNDHGEVFPVTEEHARTADYVVPVEGLSMFPYVLPGDLLAFKKGIEPEPGDIVVAKHDDEVYMKRYVGNDDGKIKLESINPMYPAIPPNSFKIIGVFAWRHTPKEAARRFNR